jgi:isovaleryl-CoA dehydrogenase
MAERASPVPDPTLLDAVDAVVRDLVRPEAALVDRQGLFPRDAVRRLGRVGALGVLSAPEVGGRGAGLGAAAAVVERLAGSCGSTAMVVLMHYAATAAIEAHGPRSVREAIARGEHLTTLALSEVGSRSHFWSPVSSAAGTGDQVRLDARKSWVTSAGEADSYVWSSRPVAAPGPMTLWLVDSRATGLTVAGPFDGFGLRGNASRPVTAEDVRVPADARLGPDGGGLDLALTVVLPVFLVLSAAFAVGVTEALLAETAAHLTGTRLEHLAATLAEQPVQRAEFGRLRLQADQARALLTDTLAAVGSGRPDAQLRVLEVKAVAGETAAAVADGAMRLCGGSAFRRELGVERRFRDALAARVMAPTTEALHDFVGRACLGLPLLDQAAGQ